MQIHHLLEQSSEAFPDKDAVWDRERWYTYRELNTAADGVAAFLVNKGMNRGDRIALLLDNSFDYTAAYFGILKAGAVVVGLNTETTAEALEYLLVNSDARCLVTQGKYRKHVFPALPSCPLVEQLVFTDDSAPEVDSPSVKTTTLKEIYDGYKYPVFVRSIDIDLAEIVYTSGSTGKPKGVMLTHLNLVSNMRSICRYLDLTGDDRIMVVLPFYYIYGKSLLLTHILTGGSVIIDNRFVYPNKILETMKAAGATGFAGVPSTFMILLNRSLLKETRLDTLRYVTQAGGAMAPAVQKEVVKAFSPAQVFIMYGATEAAPRLSWLDPELLFSKWGSIGIPVDNVDLLILDGDGNEVPRGETGEIAARGSNIMRGYWKDQEETDKVLRNGFYYTGDLGKQDEDGFFYVVGRTKDMIKVKGFRISAKEIEEAILEIGEIHETAVVGVEDPVLGEAILALVIPKEKGWKDEQKIRDYLGKKLPPIKQPKQIQFRESFPKNESGKVLKAALRQEVNNTTGETNQ